MILSKVINDSHFREFIKFGIVGFLCVAIDAGTFYILNDITGYRLAIVFGSALGLIFNYILNICWSFRAKPTFKNAFGVLIAYFINIYIVRFGLMKLFVDIFFLSDTIAYIPTLIISVISNFFIVRFVAKNL